MYKKYTRRYKFEFDLLIQLRHYLLSTTSFSSFCCKIFRMNMLPKPGCPSFMRYLTMPEQLRQLLYGDGVLVATLTAAPQHEGKHFAKKPTVKS